LIFITSVRIKKGLPWWKGSPDHFSLRMQKGGFTRMQVNIVAGVISVLIVSTACFFASFQYWIKITAILFIFLMYAVAWKYLLKWEVKR
jgi:UDP-GlcNAc:undecaprenyl-phosphate GlcNAc-1-phosphate transferase